MANSLPMETSLLLPPQLKVRPALVSSETLPDRGDAASQGGPRGPAAEEERSQKDRQGDKTASAVSPAPLSSRSLSGPASAEASALSPPGPTGDQHLLVPNKKVQRRSITASGKLDMLADRGGAGRKIKGKKDLQLGRTADVHLVIAAERGDRAAVLKALEEGANVNYRLDNDYTALCKAVENAHLDVISVLLDRKADPMVRDRASRNAWYYAFFSSHVSSEVEQLKVVDLMLQKVDRPEGEVFLMAAFYTSLRPQLTVLVLNKIKLQVLSKDSQDNCEYCVYGLELLDDPRISVMWPDGSRTRPGQTPMHIIVERCQKRKDVLGHPAVKALMAWKYQEFGWKLQISELGLFFISLLSCNLAAGITLYEEGEGEGGLNLYQGEMGTARQALEILTVVSTTLLTFHQLVLEYELTPRSLFPRLISSLSALLPRRRHLLSTAFHHHHHSSPTRRIEQLFSILLRVLGVAQHLLALALCFALVFLRYSQGSEGEQLELVAVLVVLMWLKLIGYLQLLPTLGPLFITMEAIFKNDMLLFLSVVAVNIPGFAMAMALFDLSNPEEESWSVTKHAFHLMISMAGLDHDLARRVHGVVSGAVFLMFTLLVPLLSLNLLIAMMNSTYSHIRQKSAQEWMLRKAQFILKREKLVHNPHYGYTRASASPPSEAAPASATSSLRSFFVSLRSSVSSSLVTPLPVPQQPPSPGAATAVAGTDSEKKREKKEDIILSSQKVRAGFNFRGNAKEYRAGIISVDTEEEGEMLGRLHCQVENFSKQLRGLQGAQERQDEVLQRWMERCLEKENQIRETLQKLLGEGESEGDSSPLHALPLSHSSGQSERGQSEEPRNRKGKIEETLEKKENGGGGNGGSTDTFVSTDVQDSREGSPPSPSLVSILPGIKADHSPQPSGPMVSSLASLGQDASPCTSVSTSSLTAITCPSPGPNPSLEGGRSDSQASSQSPAGPQENASFKAPLAVAPGEAVTPGERSAGELSEETKKKREEGQEEKAESAAVLSSSSSTLKDASPSLALAPDVDTLAKAEIESLVQQRVDDKGRKSKANGPLSLELVAGHQAAGTSLSIPPPPVPGSDVKERKESMGEREARQQQAPPRTSIKGPPPPLLRRETSRMWQLQQRAPGLGQESSRKGGGVSLEENMDGGAVFGERDEGGDQEEMSEMEAMLNDPRRTTILMAQIDQE